MSRAQPPACHNAQGLRLSATHACAQVDLLLGDPRKAKAELGWDPHKTSLGQLVREMVDADLEMARDPSAYLRY